MLTHRYVIRVCKLVIMGNKAIVKELKFDDSLGRIDRLSAPSKTGSRMQCCRKLIGKCTQNNKTMFVGGLQSD